MFLFGLSWSSQASSSRVPWEAELKCFCLTSNFWHQKFEAKQFLLPWTFLKTRTPKLAALKSAKISSNQFHQCNSWFLLNLLSFISLFYKVLSKLEVHLHRYFLFFIFHILFSIYASYFLFHLILSCMFLHLWKVLSWSNKCYWKRILRRYFHSSQLFMIFMFYSFFVLFKLIFSPLVCKCKALTHNNMHKWMSWISICVKNHFYTCTCYPVFLLKEYLHFVPLLFILVNCFQCNLIPWWPCLLKRLAWLLGLLHNWR